MSLCSRKGQRSDCILAGNNSIVHVKSITVDRVFIGQLLQTDTMTHNHVKMKQASEKESTFYMSILSLEQNPFESFKCIYILLKYVSKVLSPRF